MHSSQTLLRIGYQVNLVLAFESSLLGPDSQALLIVMAEGKRMREATLASVNPGSVLNLHFPRYCLEAADLVVAKGATH